MRHCSARLRLCRALWRLCRALLRLCRSLLRHCRALLKESRRRLRNVEDECTWNALFHSNFSCTLSNECGALLFEIMQGAVQGLEGGVLSEWTLPRWSCFCDRGTCSFCDAYSGTAQGSLDCFKVHLQVHLEVHLEVHLQVHLHVHLEVHLQVHLHVHLEVHFRQASCFREAEWALPRCCCTVRPSSCAELF